MQRGVIELIEAAYRTDLDMLPWLESLCAALPRRRESIGVTSYTYRIVDDWRLEVVQLATLDQSAAMTEITRALVPNVPPEYVRETWATIPCDSAIQSGPAETRAQTRAMLAQSFGTFGVKDIAVTNGLDPTCHGVYIGDLCSEELALTRRERATGKRIAAHLAAAYRLRRAASAREEAIISPSGTIEHATEAVASEEARRSLRDAAIAIDRVRSRRGDPDDAVQMWQALIAGRWTLVDRVESDGRRHYIARRNDPEVARHHALTLRERQAVGYAALGHSNKLIGYEMGLSVSTVAVYLSVAADKLGVDSRAALIQLARTFELVAGTRP